MKKIYIDILNVCIIIWLYCTGIYDDVMKDIKAYYRAVKVKLIHMHESGFLSAGPARLLMEAVDETIDHSLHDYLDLELRSTMFDRDCESDWLAWDR